MCERKLGSTLFKFQHTCTCQHTVAIKRCLNLTGARVILACRDMAKGEQAARDIMREVKGAKVVARLLDLADTKSICQFAETVYNSGWHMHTQMHTQFFMNTVMQVTCFVLQLRKIFTT